MKFRLSKSSTWFPMKITDAKELLPKEIFEKVKETDDYLIVDIKTLEQILEIVEYLNKKDICSSVIIGKTFNYNTKQYDFELEIYDDYRE